MSIIKDLPELVAKGVITDDVADRIQAHYAAKGGQAQNRMLTVFSILGGILVGLGLILIIAHNWDDLPSAVKTGLALLPLIAGQILCGYAILKKADNTAWRESTTAFLFCAIGASISLVAQIYNMPGDIRSFLLTWMLLGLPLVYVMRSSVASLLYVAGITYYAVEANYWSYNESSHWYWLLLLLALPHYYLLYKQKPESNYMVLHNWVLPLSVIICLGTLSRQYGFLMWVAYISLFGLYYLLDNTPFFQRQRPGKNGFRTYGTFGTLGCLFTLTFDSYWKNLNDVRSYFFSSICTSPEFIAASVMTLSALVLLYRLRSKGSVKNVKVMEYTFVIFLLIFCVGLISDSSAMLSMIFVNILLFIIGVMKIEEGAKANHLGILNFGLLILALLVTCRFFDSELSFVIRGGLFVAVGIGFFAANIITIKNRKKHE